MKMKEEDLVKLLDMYMSGSGRYMKPTMDENGTCNFITGKDNARPPVGHTGFETQQENPIFSGNSGTECVTCADVPNLMDVVPEED